MRTRVKIICLMLCALTVLGSVLILPVSAADPCLEVTGANAMTNNYNHWNWAEPMYSYLTPMADGGFMRFQADALSGAYLVEYFDNELNFVKQLTVPAELAIFGAFYYDGSNYYVVSGQTNMEESASVECYRVTKYDTSWKRLGFGGVYNCNTTVPFDAGCTRVAHIGSTLIIRTSHEMYTSSDGLNHQANYTIYCNTESMAMSSTANVSYSSHSFNQFVRTEGNKVVMVDHGDAYPRSVIMAVGTNSGSSISVSNRVTLQTLQGATGENYTGTYVGGLEISQSSYLTAYGMVVQDANYKTNVTKNLYIAVTNKSTLATTVKKHTAIEEGQTGIGTPWLVKINENRFAVLWQINTRYRPESTTYCLLLDGEGNAIGETKVFKGANLSDCQPVAVNGKVFWYWYQNNTVNFAVYDALGTGNFEVKEVNTGHEYVYEETGAAPSTQCTMVCKRCGQEKTFTTASYVMILWGFDGLSYSSANAVNGKVTLEAGYTASLYFCNSKRNEANHEVVMTVDYGKDVSVDYGSNGYNTMHFPENGLYIITFAYKYNPSIKTTYKIKVGDYIKAGDVNGDGYVDNQDAVLILRYEAGLTDNIQRGDVNYDGVVNNIDASLILKYDAGLIEDLE